MNAHHLTFLAAASVILLTGCPQPPATSGNDPQPTPTPPAEIETGDLLLGMQDWPRDTWRIGPPMAHERAGLSAGAFGGQVFAIGGDGEATVELLDPASGLWKLYDLPTFKNNASFRSRYFGAAAVHWNRLFYIGGTYNWTVPLADIYDPASGLWMNAQVAPARADLFARMSHAAVPLGDEILVIGGLIEEGPDDRMVPTRSVAALHPGQDVNAVDVYPRPPLDAPRAGHGAGVIAGQAYVVGGYSELPLAATPEATSSLLRYQTNAWHDDTPGGEKLARLNVARHSFGAAVLNGKLYVAGGVDSQGRTLDSVEVYDPASNRWSLKASMIAPRAHLGLAAHGGLLYAIGGYDAQGRIMRDVHVFRP